MIAGKIIPAIATTTASVTGLVTMEMLKLLQPGKKLEAYKDSSNSLGINGYFFSEPSEPVKAKDEYDVMLLEDIKCKPAGFTKWDKTLIKGTPKTTLREFRDMYKQQTGFNCVTVLHGFAGIKEKKGFSQFLYDEADSHEDSYLDKSLNELIVDLHGEDALGKTYVRLDTTSVDDEESYWKIPEVVFHFA